MIEPAITTMPQGQRRRAGEDEGAATVILSKDQQSLAAQEDSPTITQSSKDHDCEVGQKESRASGRMSKDQVLGARHRRKGAIADASQDHAANAPSNHSGTNAGASQDPTAAVPQEDSGETIHHEPQGQKLNVSPDLIIAIQQQHRQRRDLVRARGDCERRIKSICRRAARNFHCHGEKCAFKLCKPDEAEYRKLCAAVEGRGHHVLIEQVLGSCGPVASALEPLAESERVTTKALEELARELPLAAWAKAIRGFSILALAQLVGEAGDISRYRSLPAFYKRMGLAVFDGKAQAKHKNAEVAKMHGFSPQRRSIVWAIGDCLIKAKSPYKAMYDARKEYELARGITRIHAHRRAKRYMEKRLLKDLWIEWHRIGASAS